MNITKDLYQMIKPKILEVIKDNLLKVFELSYKFNAGEDLDRFYKEIKDSYSEKTDSIESDDLGPVNLNDEEPVNLITKKPIPKSNKKNNRYSSKYKGVQYDPTTNKWRARVYLKKVAYSIGSFTDEVTAAMEYDREKFKITKNKKDLNFPENRY